MRTFLFPKRWKFFNSTGLKQLLNPYQHRSFVLKCMVLSLSFSILFHQTIFSQQCTFLISPSPVTTIISPNTCPNIKPGDVICLDTLPFNQILILDLHGEPENPIILRNSGRQAIIYGDSANYGISVRYSSNLVISGNGYAGSPYGIAIARVGRGAGLSLDQYSTDITVSHVEISNTALAGLIAKTDPDCSFNSLRDKFTMYNITVRDCYLHDIGMEGIYIGNTFYNGRVIHCNDHDTLVYPHVLEGVRVYRNIIERTGRNGMQLNSTVLDCQIFDNQISFDSSSETPNQMGGIQIGGGSICDCFNNRISYGKGSGIEIFGRGNFMIYNNVIEYPGRSFKPDTAHSLFPKHGIFIKDVNTDPGASISIFHNTIIFPKSDGILFTNQYLPASRIQNNIIIGPGAYQQIGENAYVHHNNIDLMISNNFFSTCIEQASFNDYFANDYTLSPKSPAIDNGADLSEFGLDFDKSYALRPQGKGFDIGAFEANPQDVEHDSPNIKVYPNPLKDNVKILFSQPFEGAASIELFGLTGNLIYTYYLSAAQAGVNEVDISLDQVSVGLYLLRVVTAKQTFTSRLVKSE